MPDPAKFFTLLDPTTNHAMRSTYSTKLLLAKPSTKQKTLSNRLQQAAFGLLQWAHHGETINYEPPKTDTSDDSSSGDELLEDNDDYNPADEEAKQPSPNWVQAQETTAELQEMQAPSDFKVQLRPYQRQALWWMTQREAQEELEESSRQQLELLEEMLSPSHTAPSVSSSSLSSSSLPDAILCDCGPVQVDTTRIEAPPVLDNGNKSELKHPLWERRYLSNATRTKALSFYVQPLFAAAMASPPPPPRPCRGGILADSMGLGKTVMLLALIQSSLDPTRQESNKTTLIISPLSLLAQWQEEIESKTSLKYCVYYGDKKENDNFDSVDVVLTTYGSLQGEWLAHSKSAEGANQRGLVGHSWKRIILDEAHCVKNTATVASRACCLLQAERRWCVSGTIIQNSLDDVYALLKFLKHEPWCQSSFWKATISSNLRNNDSMETKQQALDRVRRLLAPIMLRRTKASVDKAGYVLLIN